MCLSEGHRVSCVVGDMQTKDEGVHHLLIFFREGETQIGSYL